MFLGREVNRTETHSEKTSEKIDAEIDAILNGSHETAIRILNDHRDRLELIAELLIKYETLDGEQVMGILKTGKEPEGLVKNGGEPAPGTEMNPAEPSEVIPDVPPAE